MNKKKSFNASRSEKIARVYLSALNNIKISDAAKSRSADFIIYPKNDVNKKVIVEVKAVKEISKVKDRYETVRKRLKKEKSPAVIFYIDGENEKGGFEVINQEGVSGIYPLTGSTLSTQISKLVEKI